MAYSVDWVAKIFTIPQGDLTFISGNNYSLSMVDVHEELRRLEWAFADGLWAPNIAKWFETVTLSGIDKTPSLEIINDYTFDFTGSNYNVILTDYDNNLVDVYIPSNGISILGNNSVGRQTISTGSGLDSGQDTKLTRIHALLDVIEGTLDHQEVMRILLAAAAGKASGAEGTNMKFRDQADGKDRIDATVDQYGNRSSVSVDAS